MCVGDLAGLGACLNSAQQQKLVMAPGKHDIEDLKLFVCKGMVQESIIKSKNGH